MTYDSILDAVANWSAVLTFIGGIYVYFKYRGEKQLKQVRLEKYLQQAKTVADAGGRGKKGQHTIIHLMKEVGLTEAEILQASFDSNHIQRLVWEDADGRAAGLLLAYKD